LSCPAFGIAHKQTRDLLVLFSQSMTNHALQDSDDPQSDGEAGE
jgi:hypothetical protein